MFFSFALSIDLLRLGLVLARTLKRSIRECFRDLVDLLELPRESSWVQEWPQVETVIIRAIVLLCDVQKKSESAAE